MKKNAEFINSEYFFLDKNSNPLSLFKKIGFKFNGRNYSIFKLIERSFPFCEKIEIWSNLSEELEIITNPIFLSKWY